MNNLLLQTAIHVSARLVSVGLSFFLFAWIGNVLSIENAGKAYFFGFVVGFFLATSKMIIQMGARVNSTERLSERYRCACQGVAIQAKILVPAVFLLGIYIWINTHNYVVLSFSLPILFVAALDVDLFRSVLNKPSLFSVNFSIGNVLAIFLLYYFLPRTLEGVLIALIAQWVPVAIFNGKMIPIFIKIIKSNKTTNNSIFKIFILAVFDGFILNSPFFGWLDLSTDVSFNLSLIVRIFVASLPILPLIMHLANSPDFGKICEKYKFNQEIVFGATLLLSGIAAGMLFLFVYKHISDYSVPLGVLFVYFILLSSYVFYISKARFSSKLRNSKLIYVLYCVVFVVYLIGLNLFTKNNLDSAFGIVGCQAAALLSVGIGLYFLETRGVK